LNWILKILFFNDNTINYTGIDIVEKHFSIRILLGIEIIRGVIFHLTNDQIQDIFNQLQYSEKNINIEPFNKSYNVITKISEPEFNRHMYIYTHNSFYS
jgi:hypothetical protein